MKLVLILILHLLIFIVPFSVPGQITDSNVVISSELPLGNVAVSTNGRIFYTLHPEGKPKSKKLFEHTSSGTSIPYPNQNFQKKLQNPLGIYISKNNTLWVIDHGKFGLGKPALFGIDLTRDSIIYTYYFSNKEVQNFTMLNDLCVSKDNRHIFISVPQLFGRKKARLLIHDTKSQSTRTFLKGHESVIHNKTIPTVDGKKMSFLLGLIKIRPGIDGIDISEDGNWLYYTGMCNDSIYKVKISMLMKKNNIDITPVAVSSKPINDGIKCYDSGLILTDVENKGLMFVRGEIKKKIIYSEKFRWVDGLSIHNDYVYLTDSALQNVVLKSKKKLERTAHIIYTNSN